MVSDFGLVLVLTETDFANFIVDREDPCCGQVVLLYSQLNLLTVSESVSRCSMVGCSDGILDNQKGGHTTQSQIWRR